MINEKTLESILADLSKTPGDSVTYENARQSLDTAVGRSHYSISYDKMNIITAKQTEHFSVRCTIKFLDDSGTCLLSYDFYSCNEINYKDKAPGEPVHLANAMDKAQKESFRRCAMQLFSQKAKPNSKRSESLPKIQETPKAIRTGSGETYEVNVTSSFKETSYKTHMASCQILKGPISNDEADLVCWNDFASKMKAAGKWDKFLATCQTHSIKVNAKSRYYKGRLQLTIVELL
jgi:hypothetical protein